VDVDLSGVTTRAHVFVVKSLHAQVILGRPWERAVYACFENRKNGDYMLTITSPDGRRRVEVCICPAEHERNREFVRDPLPMRPSKF
jgi:hypothetical protein